MIRHLAIAGLLTLSLTACRATPSVQPQSSTPTKESSVSLSQQFSAAPGVLPDDQIQHKDAVITTPKGTIHLQFFPDEAPLAVSNFIFLTQHKFYDGLTFHRVEPGFVIQGGDPNGNGTGGPGYKFNDEPVKRSYTRGIVAMANAGPNTNGSQFFIMLADTPLPPSYTIFGQVTEGMDVVEKVVIGDVMTSVAIVDSK